MLFPQGSLDEVEEGTHLLAILDEHWEEYLGEKDCAVRDRLNRWKVPLVGEAKDQDAYFKTSIRQVRAYLLVCCTTFGITYPVAAVVHQTGAGFICLLHHGCCYVSCCCRCRCLRRRC